LVKSERIKRPRQTSQEVFIVVDIVCVCGGEGGEGGRMKEMKEEGLK